MPALRERAKKAILWPRPHMGFSPVKPVKPHACGLTLKQLAPPPGFTGFTGLTLRFDIYVNSESPYKMAIIWVKRVKPHACGFTGLTLLLKNEFRRVKPVKPVKPV